MSDTFLPPIETPRGLIMKLAYYFTRRQLGKVLMYQTSYFRNSDVGQWRYYELAEDMTPKNIDWKMFLGHEFEVTKGPKGLQASNVRKSP